MDYLDSRLKEHGGFNDDWTEMRDLYSRKLWHQLTLRILGSLKKPGFVSSVDLDQFNDNFLNSIKQKINPLSLAEIIVPISEGMVKTDPQKTIKFIEENRNKYMSLNDEAVILSNSTIGMIRLLILGDMSGARDIIESTGEILSKIDGVTSVHSRFYRMSSHYYKLMGQHAEYYREALRFLGCTDMAELPAEEKQDWAFSVGLAALLGNGVYNFGELISHEVLEELRNNAKNAWLVDLLHAFNKGDLQKIASLKPTWTQNKDLAAAAPLLEEKARLLALMELFFRRPPNQRTISFEDIAKATGTSIDRVEFTVMRALSLNLMKGRIDEVKNTVSLVWLQPRVLDLDQIASMAERLKAWNASVESARNLVAVDAKAILA